TGRLASARYTLNRNPSPLFRGEGFAKLDGASHQQALFDGFFDSRVCRVDDWSNSQRHNVVSRRIAKRESDREARNSRSSYEAKHQDFNGRCSPPFVTYYARHSTESLTFIKFIEIKP